MTEEVESRPCRGASLGNFDGVAALPRPRSGDPSWLLKVEGVLGGGRPRVIGPPIPPAIPGCLQTAHSSSIATIRQTSELRSRNHQTPPTTKSARACRVAHPPDESPTRPIIVDPHERDPVASTNTITTTRAVIFHSALTRQDNKWYVDKKE